MEEYINRYQIYFALKYNLISEEEFLEKLIISSIGEDFLVAYRHYLLLYQERKAEPRQILSNGKYFFEEADEKYLLIYALMGFSLHHPKFPGDKLAQVTIKYFEDKNFMRFIDIIIKAVDDNGSYEDVQWAIAARQYNINKRPYPFYELVHCNAIPQLAKLITAPISERFYHELVDHCTELYHHQSNLWFYLRREFITLIRKFYDNNLIPYSSRLFTRLLKLLPELFPPEYINTFTPLAWKIYHLPLHRAGYYLGYPSITAIKSRDEIIPTLGKLSKLGVVDYCEKFKEENKKYQESLINLNTAWTIFGSKRNSFVNERDTLYEDVFSYSPNDLIIYSDNHGKYFLFSLPELPNIVNKRKNHWTNLDLPGFFIEATKAVLKERQKLYLPSSKILLDLLRDLEKEDKSEEDEEEDEDEDLEMSQLQIQTILDNISDFMNRQRQVEL